MEGKEEDYKGVVVEEKRRDLAWQLCGLRVLVFSPDLIEGETLSRCTEYVTANGIMIMTLNERVPDE